MQAQLRFNYPDKKMYEYVNFAFIPKQLRQIELKRKSIIKNVEAQTLKQRKKDSKMGSPIQPRQVESKTSPRIIRSTVNITSPRKVLLTNN